MDGDDRGRDADVLAPEEPIAAETAVLTISAILSHSISLPSFFLSLFLALRLADRDLHLFPHLQVHCVFGVNVPRKSISTADASDLAELCSRGACSVS